MKRNRFGMVWFLSACITGCISGCITSCISGPNKDGRTFAEKLNGQNYESTNTVAGIPVESRKPIERKFAGHVYCGEGVGKTPANHAEVRLSSLSQTVASVYSTGDGEYSLSGSVDPSASYELAVVSSCGSLRRSLLSEEKHGADALDLDLK